jgi:Rrf2 family protein
LTQFSDYSLRLVIHLACHPGQLISVDEVSRAFRISRHHLVRVVQRLTDLGVVEGQRGRGGGMRLARLPTEINVGWLVRQIEPHFDLVECFDPTINSDTRAVEGPALTQNTSRVAFWHRLSQVVFLNHPNLFLNFQNAIKIR